MHAFVLVNIPLCSQINILVIFFPFVILVPSGMFFSTGWASTVLLFARVFFLLAKEKIISLQKNSSLGSHMRMECWRQFFICVSRQCQKLLELLQLVLWLTSFWGQESNDSLQSFW
jgi:hypothetical protein